MKTITQLAAATLAVLSLAGANTVFAYQGQGKGPGPGAAACEGQAAGMGYGTGYGAGYGMDSRPGMGYGMRGGKYGPETPAVAAARLSDLKAELKITATQEAAWQTYATVVQQQAEQRQAMRTQMQAQMQAQAQSQAQAQDPQAAAGVDRSAQRQAMQSLRDSHFAARDAALKDLYAVLTPEQKALADQRLRGPYGHRMAMRGAAL